VQQEVLDARERLLGREHPDTLTTKNNLALTLRDLGDLEGARRVHEEVLEAQRHPSRNRWAAFATSLTRSRRPRGNTS
jgi:hypothetical protein